VVVVPGSSSAGVVCGGSVDAGDVVCARRVRRSPGVEVSGVEEEALGCSAREEGFRVSGLGLRVWGLKFMAHDLEFRVYLGGGLRCRVLPSRSRRDSGSGARGSLRLLR